MNNKWNISKYEKNKEYTVCELPNYITFILIANRNFLDSYPLLKYFHENLLYKWKAPSCDVKEVC